MQFDNGTNNSDGLCTSVVREIFFEISMKKAVFCFSLLFLSVGSAFSQFDAQLSQYMFHNSSFNPAAVGEGDMIQIIGQHRIQWVGMPNAPQTTVFSINSPVKIGNVLQGIGVKFLNDKVGLFTNQSAHLQYAFKKKLGVGLLSVGADFGLETIGFDGSKDSIPTGDYHNPSDPQIPKTNVKGMAFDMNLGVFYSTPKLYAGISYLHVNSPKVSWGNNIEFKQTGSMFFTGGYNLILPDSKYVLKPSTLIKTDMSSVQCDLTARMEYDNKYWGGISCRIQDAVVFLAGINISNGLSIGYSYDLPISKIITASSGSHEILVMYSFEYVFAKKHSKYKSIRIL